MHSEKDDFRFVLLRICFETFQLRVGSSFARKTKERWQPNLLEKPRSGQLYIIMYNVFSDRLSVGHRCIVFENLVFHPGEGRFQAGLIEKHH